MSLKLNGLTVTDAINGSVTGNAATATTLQTARNINGTSFNGSADITTANWGTARTLTIGSAGKSVNGSAAVAWTLAEIGAVPVAGGTMSGVLTTYTPGVQTSVTGLSAFNAGVNVGERNVGSVAGFVPGYGQTTVYTGGYRSHMILGSYRTASSWGGGPFIAWGGNDNNATEYWLFNQGGAITHSGGKTMAYTDGTNASGSWPISITGSSATAGSATTAAGLSATLAVASGGTGGNTQALGRTGLGATTLGANLFTLGNVAAERYIRINANNTVDTLTVADFKDALSIGSGSGTVTGVNGTAPIASSGGTAPNITLNNAGVTFAKIQNIAQGSVIGRSASGTGVSSEIDGSGIASIISSNYVLNATNATTAATANALNVSNSYTVTQLDVATASTPSLFVRHTGTSPSAIRLLAYTNSNYIQSGTSTSNSSADLIFSSMGAATEWMRIKGATGRVGIGTSNPDYLLDVNGTIHYTTLTASSDGRFKKNVQVISNPLDKLSSIRGVRFEWNEFVNDRRNGYELNKPTFGVIAQELEEVFPELVSRWKLSDDCTDARSVNYEKIIPILIEAVKELNNKNKLLESRLLILENK